MNYECFQVKRATCAPPTPTPDAGRGAQHGGPALGALPHARGLRLLGRGPGPHRADRRELRGPESFIGPGLSNSTGDVDTGVPRS